MRRIGSNVMIMVTIGVWCAAISAMSLIEIAMYGHRESNNVVLFPIIELQLPPEQHQTLVR